MPLRRLLLSLSMLVAAACAVPQVARSQEGAPRPDARPVLQVIPPGDDVQWGGAGGAFTVTGRSCETSIVDARAARVTARIAACRVWPSPTRDVFLAHMEGGSLVAWDASGARGAVLSPEFARDASPAWSPDGTQVATLAGDSIRLATAGRETDTRILPIPTDAGSLAIARSEVSWRADGALLAVRDRTHVWTVGARGEPASVLPTGCAAVRQVRFAPRGDGLLVGCDEDRAELWDTRANRRVTTMPRVRDWSATARHVTVLAPAVEVRDATTGTTELRPRGATYDRFQFSRDDAWLANDSTAAGAPWVDVWDVAANKRVLHLPGTIDPRWSADGAFLSVRSVDAKMPGLVVLAAGSWKEVWRRQDTAQGAWSPAGARLAVTSATAGLDVLDATAGSTRAMPSATTAWFARLYQAADGALMAPTVSPADGRGQAVRIDASGRATVVDVPAEVQQAWSSPDGSRRVRSVSQQRAVLMAPSVSLYIEDVATKEHFFLDHGFGEFDARWSARGHRLLLVHGEPLLFDADTHRVWRVPVKQPSATALDAEGTRAALEAPDGLQVVRLASKEPPIRLSPRSDPPPTLLALSGSRLAAVTREGEVSVWNVESREVVASWSAGFAPDHVSWVGDASRLALSRREVLRLSDADGSNAVTVTALRGPAGTSILSERVTR